MSVRVKICGVARVEDARAAIDAGADLIGLNFHPESPRYVSGESARQIARTVHGSAKLVGVFVSASRELVARTCDELALDLVQLYGDEIADADVGVPVIRALRLRPGTSAAAFPDLNRRGSGYVLLDSYDSRLFGGTGKALDLDALAGFDLSRAFIAGGLDAETVGRAAALNPYGVDVASGVESAPGIKDHRKLRSFIRNAKSSQ